MGSKVVPLQCLVQLHKLDELLMDMDTTIFNSGKCLYDLNC